MDCRPLLSHRLPPLLLAVAVGLVPSPGSAQQPADRAALDAFWVSLLQTNDTGFVDQTRRALTRERKRDGNPLIALREGLAETRFSAMGYPRRSGDAEKAFKRAREARPEWPYPWYGHGLAKLAQARWQMDNSLNIGNRVGVGAMETAQAAFLEAIRIDATFEPALVELGRVALRLRTPARLEEALGALRRSAGLRAWSDRELYLLRAQLEFRVGRRDSARISFRGSVRACSQTQRRRSQSAIRQRGNDLARWINRISLSRAG